MTLQSQYYQSRIILRASPCKSDDQTSRWLERLRDRSPGPTITLTSTRARATTLKQEALRHGLVAQDMPHQHHAAGDDAAVPHWFRKQDHPVLLLPAADGVPGFRNDIRYTYWIGLPDCAKRAAEAIAATGTDGGESTVEIIPTTADRIHTANAIEAIYPDPVELQSLYNTLANADLSVGIAAHTLAAQAGVPLRTVDMLLDELVTSGCLREKHAIFSKARLQPLHSSGQILKKFDHKRARFLQNMFRCAKPVKRGFELDIAAACKASNEPRDRVLSALKYLEEKNDLAVTLGSLRYTFESSKFPPSPEMLLAEIEAVMTRHRDEAVTHLNAVVAWVEHAGCRWRELLRVLGEEFGRDCGHCDWCLGVRPGLLPAESASIIDWESATALRNENPDAFASPRALARFLTGFQSPAWRMHLRHPLFGAATRMPFADVLKALAAE